jgi:hypothetical protein
MYFYTYSCFEVRVRVLGFCTVFLKLRRVDADEWWKIIWSNWKSIQEVNIRSRGTKFVQGDGWLVRNIHCRCPRNLHKETIFVSKYKFEYARLQNNYPRLQKKKKSKILSFSWFLRKKKSWKMVGFFEQNFNFSLFYQNLIKTIFFKNSKRTWLGKVWTKKKWKKPDFHVSTVKSRTGTTKSRFFFSRALT